MHTSLKKDAGSKHRPEPASNGVCKYSCKKCGETWTAHVLVKECHKCGSRDLERAKRAERLTKIELKARKSGPWKCFECQHIWWVNGVVPNCCKPDCASGQVAPVEAKWCATCFRWYDMDELSCPDCGNQEFALIDGSRPRNTTASDAIEAGRRHLNGDAPPAAAKEPTTPKPQQAAVIWPLSREDGEAILYLQVKDIDAHPDNPRKHFDQAGLEELAAGFKNVGVINALTVRRLGHVFQLVAGERRWRAAKIAGLKTVPCRIVDITDEEAYEVMIRENLDREDLDEIEKARSYKLGLEKCGLSQEAFAKRYKKSQEHVSNTIRLLALPEAWQQRLIQRQITATHARELLAWVDTPAVLDKVGKRFDPKDVPSTVDFRRQILDAVRDASRDMTYCNYDYGNGCRFKPTPAQAKELDIRDVPQSWGGKCRRAFNTKLWAELQGAAKKRREEKQAKEGKGSPQGGRRSATPAEAAKRARVNFLQSLWRYKRNWLAARIGERLQPSQYLIVARTSLLMLMDESGTGSDRSFWQAVGLKHDWDADKNAATVAALNLAQASDFLFEAVKIWLSQPNESGYHEPVPPAWLGSVAQALKIDLARDWKPDAAFLALYDEKGLLELPDGFDEDSAAAFDAAKDKPGAVLANWPAGYVPHELLWVNEDGEIKRPKGASPKAAKKKAKAKR
jgi:ParB/RepB/Spo0J family partition protein